MKVKLQVVQGKLQSRKGRDVGMEVDVHRDHFIIGSGEESNMRCVSRSVSERHCEITLYDKRATIRDLGSEHGTFVNDERVDEPRLLRNGDCLRIGKLEFQVLIEQSPSERRSRADDVGDYVSDLLSEADEIDRARRMEDPETRKYRPGPQEEAPAAEAEPQPAEEPKKKFVRPERKPPAKLPPPPPFVAENTIEAAEETLKKMFHK